MTSLQQTVIVAGGGYAGVLAANRVQGRLAHARVLLISPETALTDRIRLHQRAVHGTDVERPYPRLLARKVEHIQARVVDLEPQGRGLAIADSAGTRWLAYDALILALGSSLGAHSPGDSPLSAALRDSAHARQLAAALPQLPDGACVQVIGGGLTAIELSSELAEAYPRLHTMLLTEQLVPGLDAAARQVLREELLALKIDVREGVTVESVQPGGGVRLRDGSQLSAAISVLAAGFAPAPPPAASGLAQVADGRVLVDEHLRVSGLDNVFAAGDFAAPPARAVGSGVRTTRMGCVNAMPQGAHAADQVARLLKRQPLVPFHCGYMIQCISIGRRRGVVVFVDRDDKPTGRVIRGRVGALIKEAICRFVIGGLRLERHRAGLYAWPEQRHTGLLPETTTPTLAP